MVSNLVPGGPQLCRDYLQPAPNHTCLEVSSNPEDIDYLDQVCLIRVGTKLCRAMALQEFSLRPVL